MDIEGAINERILTRVLNEAVRRGDVIVRLDSFGEPRFSAAEPDEDSLAVSLSPLVE